VTAQASFNPRNGLVVPAPASDTPEAVDAVVATAAAAAEPMAAVPPATRAGWLTAIADAVEADAEPLAALALAAGCPVVVKAHPARPRLSARLAEIAGEAMAGAGVTTGPFGIVHGFDAGTRLVSHPACPAGPPAGLAQPVRWCVLSGNRSSAATGLVRICWSTAYLMSWSIMARFGAMP
jgi:acyl-CoA reductase-like NAD-dependent aldehyde dehydrogenase